jgi:serpin B
VNAIYLKAPWLEPFPASDTKDAPFTNADGTTVQVPMMRTQLSLLHAQGDGWQAVEIPYVGGSLAMTVVVPDAGRLAEIEGRLADGLMDTVVTTSGTKTVRLAMPRFDIETKVELARVMAALGMPTAFDPDRADFSAMVEPASPNADQRRLFIDLIVHQANITVDEKGTEAAAATAVVMRESSAPGSPVVVDLDRPFLYAVRDVPTGAILFLGRVSNLG